MESKNFAITSIDALANKLGISVERLMEYYIKEAKLFRVYFWIRWAVVTPITYGLCKVIWWVYLMWEASRYSDDGLMFGLILLLVVGLINLIVIIVFLFNIEEYIRSIYNPEYMATSNLFSQIFGD